jgi:serine/threonine-protein kinase HipA
MKKLDVHLVHSPDRSFHVGQLVETEHRIYFEFDPVFIDRGFNISPIRLPLQPGLIGQNNADFGPLHGVFDDSLPDGWGRLLMDRHFRDRNIQPDAISPLDRLAYVGARTMGALTYHPAEDATHWDGDFDLNLLGKNAEKILEGQSTKILPQLIQAGGTPGGARPKVLVGIKDDHIISGENDLPDGYSAWMIKFAAKKDARDAGPVEYAYHLMAVAAKIDVPQARLFEAGKDRRYFGVQRFDRLPGNNRVHVHTFGNLIHANFRIPGVCSYSDLFKVTRNLTSDYRNLLKIFRRMVFNIAAHNRDDHVKNFAFVMDHEGRWDLSPAYDLVYSSGPGGEHSMIIDGEGANPTRSHCLNLAAAFKITAKEATEIIDQVNAAVTRWPQFASEAGCSRQMTSTIKSAIRAL